MWTYQGQDFDVYCQTIDQAAASDHSHLSSFVGFVYQIEDLQTGKKYIGQKKFWQRRTSKKVPGKRRKRTITESDWRDYWGSNDRLRSDVARKGAENFRRVILILCKRKCEMNYYEMREQVLNDVLMKPAEYYNAYIGGRISRQQLGIKDEI